MTKSAHGRKYPTEHLDPDDRLVQVSKGVYASGAVLVNEFTVNYSYDSMGRMFRRDNGTDVTTFVWDDWGLLSETTDSVVTTYLVPDGLVWSFSRGEDVFQVHTDALGSVRVVTDSDGDVVARFEYGAWGELLPGSFDSVGFALRFVGGYGVRTDLETGLLWMRHRWYDATLQRFISRDPIGLEGGANLYAYVDGMPQSVTDEMGLKTPFPAPVRPQGRPTRGVNISPQMHAEMMRISPAGYRAVTGAGQFNIPVRPASGPVSLPSRSVQRPRQELQRTRASDIRRNPNDTLTDFRELPRQLPDSGGGGTTRNQSQQGGNCNDDEPEECVSKRAEANNRLIYANSSGLVKNYQLEQSNINNTFNDCVLKGGVDYRVLSIFWG